jgi:hypothetical protein
MSASALVAEIGADSVSERVTERKSAKRTRTVIVRPAVVRAPTVHGLDDASAMRSRSFPRLLAMPFERRQRRRSLTQTSGSARALFSNMPGECVYSSPRPQDPGALRRRGVETPVLIRQHGRDARHPHRAGCRVRAARGRTVMATERRSDERRSNHGWRAACRRRR